MKMSDKKLFELRRIADLTKKSLPKTKGFIIFLEFDHEMAYIANANRSDAIDLLEEWLARVDTMWIGPPQPVAQTQERTKQEDRCALIGQALGVAARVCLFVFDFEPGGVMSYWTNIDDVKNGIRNWIRDQKKQ